MTFHALVLLFYVLHLRRLSFFFFFFFSGHEMVTNAWQQKQQTSRPRIKQADITLQAP